MLSLLLLVGCGFTYQPGVIYEGDQQGDLFVSVQGESFSDFRSVSAEQLAHVDLAEGWTPGSWTSSDPLHNDEDVTLLAWIDVAGDEADVCEDPAAEECGPSQGDPSGVLEQVVPPRGMLRLTVTLEDPS